jgi:hypothetical protein
MYPKFASGYNNNTCILPISIRDASNIKQQMMAEKEQKKKQMNSFMKQMPIVFLRYMSSNILIFINFSALVHVFVTDVWSSNQ